MACPTSALLHTFPFESVQKKTNIIPQSILSIGGFVASEPTCGSITVSKNLEQHPTCSVELFLKPTDTEAVDQVLEAKLSQYQLGTEIEIFNTTYIVNKHTPMEYSLRRNATRTIVLKIDLVGKWSPKGNTRRNPLDEPYKIFNTNNATLSEIVNLAGETYVGPDIDVYFQGNASINLVTPRLEIERNAASVNGFVFWSNPDSPEIKIWGQTTQRQLPLNIVSTENLVQPRIGQGALIDGVKLVEEYRNTRFVPKKIIGNTGTEVLIEYENATNEDEFNAPLYDSDSWFLFGPAVIEPFKNGNNTFDNASQVRKKRVLETKNGEVIAQTEEIKGWEYTTPSFYTITDTEIIWDPPSILVVNGFWKTVENSTTVKYFDRDGYWIGDSTTGSRRARFKQETGIEASEAQRDVEANPGDQVFEDIRDTFSFFDLPINGQTFNLLDEKGDFYSDIRPGDDGVKPKYVVRKRKTDLNLVVSPDPGSTEEEPLPDMITGRDFFEEVIINIVSPKSATSPQNPEKYRQSNYIRNAQGQALGRYAKTGSSKTFAGRPPNAPRLIELTGDYDTPTGDLVAGGSYLLVSEGVTIDVSQDISRDSVAFDNIFTQNELLEAARAGLSKRNVSAMTTTIELNTFVFWNEGDLVNYRNRQWVLTGYQYTVKPQRSNGSTILLNDGYTVTLGSYLVPGVDLYQVDENNEVILIGSISGE